MKWCRASTRLLAAWLVSLLCAGSIVHAQTDATQKTQKKDATKKAAASGKKPNILVIWGDDIGTWNISHNNRGMMGYMTPNIDRIAKEGVGFTDYYGQQSCTAGRAAFIGGNVPLRTGMTKVGVPGAKEGWQKTDVTMATVLKSLGYATGQFGKNHQGDRDEHLPTMHGFDEFLGRRWEIIYPILVAAFARTRAARTLASAATGRLFSASCLRQPLPPQRGGGAGERGLSEGPGVPEKVRPARRAQVQGRRQGRPDHRRHRPADQETHGDH